MQMQTKKAHNTLTHHAGKRYGKYVLIRRVENKHHTQRWLCRCDCGNKREIFMSSLISGKSKSCGCHKKVTAGQRYGRYTLISRVENKYGAQRWLCKCDCGTQRELFVSSLINSGIKSCGCVVSQKMNEWKKKVKTGGHWLKKGMKMPTGCIQDSPQILSPPIELRVVEASRQTACTFCGKYGFSQKNILHYQLFSGNNTVDLCYGCALAIAERLWLKFFGKEYKAIIRRG